MNYIRGGGGICGSALLPSTVSHDLNIYFGKTLTEKSTGKNGSNIPHVGGGFQNIHIWVMEIEELVLTYVGNIDISLCLLS